MQKTYREPGTKMHLNIDGTTVVGTICAATADNTYVKVCHDPDRTVIYRLEADRDSRPGEAGWVMLGTTDEQIGKWYITPDQVIKINLNPDKK